MSEEKSLSDIIQQLSQQRANGDSASNQVVLKSQKTDFSLNSRVEISSHPVMEMIIAKREHENQQDSSDTPTSTESNEK